MSRDQRPIYLDHQAHAPIDPRVAAALADAFLMLDSNPHATHAAGLAAHAAVEAARHQVAMLIGAGPAEILFTSGATESNNLAILGLVERLAAVERPRVLVSEGEHPSVLAAAEATGMKVDRIPLLSSGRIDLSALEELLSSGTGLVSIAMANHEIGTIQPMVEIAARVRAAGALLHSDLAQAAGKVAIDASLFDVASLSSHKLGGPVGVGALYIRRSVRRHLRPITHGGGQEGGLRPGTVPAPLCFAFGEACRIAREEMGEEAERVRRLRDDLLAQLAEVGGVEVNGGLEERLPGNLNLSFAGVDAEALVLRLREAVAFATGSACTSASLEPSHVLAAIGIRGPRAEGAVRLSLGRSTTAEDVQRAAQIIAAGVKALRTTYRRVA